jgi:predicted phage-related endonuclease
LLIELNVLVSPQNRDYEEWKDMRRKRIGGSDTAVIAGLGICF